jgi:predicted porin
MRTTLMAALLAAGTTVNAAEPVSTDVQALIEAQQKQIEILQQQLDATRASLTDLARKVEENTTASVEANEKAEILAESFESQPVLAEPSVKIGGYGELHANLLEDQVSGEDSNMLDLHRFVLFYQHDFNDRLRFNSELEVEHAVSGGDEPGEVELEQAYVEYDWAENHSLKAGLFLIPVGILNETHEPPTFYGTERNPVEKNIIPTTWWEGGVSFTGRLDDAFSYDFAAHSGLYTTAGDSYKVRSGRQKGAKAKFDAMAYTGRLQWRGIPGLELSASVQYQEDLTQETDPTAGSAWMYTGHMAWRRGNFGLRALYANWDLDGSGPEAIGADEQSGWYVEPSWRFNRNWGVFARYNSWDNKAGNSSDTEYTQWDIGVNYWLHPNVVFKLDYQDQDAPDGKKELDGWNLGVGYQF